jgi:hypothetical protein
MMAESKAMRIVTYIAISLLSAGGARCATPAENEVAEVDAVIRRYAGEDSEFKERDAAYKAVIWDKGLSVVPILEALFASSKEKDYRNSLVAQLFKIEGNAKNAVSFIERELAKPWNEWQRPSWVKTALGNVVKVDQEKARQLAIRVVDQVGDSGVAAIALGILEDVGQPSDIDAIREAVKGWSRHDREEREFGADGVIASGDIIIKAIQARPEKLVTPSHIPPMSAPGEPASRVAKKSPEQVSASETAESGPQSRWVIGILVALAVGGLVALLKRFR